ncbi:MAG: transposase, partial [Candidatus Acidiferrum sp.]
VHDSQELDDVLDPDNDSQDIWADSAYRSEEQEQRRKEKGCPSHIHERAYRNKPLTPEQEAANTERSRVRVRVEHVFGHMATAMNGCYVRTIGIARARAKTGLENIAYNISCFTFLMGAHPTRAAPSRKNRLLERDRDGPQITKPKNRRRNPANPYADFAASRFAAAGRP